jgi:tRNA-dihydrouridine synthase
MKTPGKIAAIFQQMTAHFDIPITGKIRLGWDENHLNYLEVARVIEENGGAMVAVHGRTRKQAYRGKARWKPIREVKEALQIPVVGNGDVQTVEDIEIFKKITGVDAVMIGRAAVGNPWIFSRINRQDVPSHEVYNIIEKHLNAMLSFYGERGVITFRKYLKAYLKPYSLPAELLHNLLTSKDPNIILNSIKVIL